MINLITTYDIPYTAQYSKDGSTVYIHRLLPRYFTTTTGMTVDVYTYLTLHEVTEKSLMDRLGLSFNQAHWYAVGAEVSALSRDRVPLDEYYGFLGPYIREFIKPENIHSVPSDLDLRPLQEDNLDSVLVRIEELTKVK